MVAVLFDLEGTLVRSVENDQKAVLDFRIKRREKLLELGIPSAELGNVVKSTLMRNRALEHVEKHFTKQEAGRFHLEMDRFLKAFELSWARDSEIFPERFRKYLAPAYSKMFTPAREKGVHVLLHSDGHIIEVADDLIRAGVTILNPQDLVNGIENIQRRLKGKVCIDLDIDRQRTVPFGTPREVKRHVHKIVSALNEPTGGFMITVGIYPPTPIENIEALCEALEEAGGGPKH